MISWYWTVTTLTTTGFGDIYPKSVAEKWISIVAMGFSIFISISLYVHFIYTLTIFENEKRRTEVLRRLEVNESLKAKLKGFNLKSQIHVDLPFKFLK